ncbi:hypothetical protein [Georgenia sp. SYP-B2076]|uniref:hypothetical protein n=1 Tax=Georgenia sp. SYP-B2076 TaxID=2495881 RepID=UPI000F8E2AA3|nr:hypothetical protein [Georgenia sp. SYP-B2076]
MTNADIASITRTAANQYDVITRQQLLAAGATLDWISRQVRNRRWRRLFPGVYVVHTGTVRWRTSATAALLYAGSGAALSHSSAAFLHGLRDRPGELIHVCVPSSRRVRPQRGLRIHVRDRMPPAWGHLRATSPIATVLDLASLKTTTEDDVVGLVCAAVQKNIDIAEILTEVARRKRQRHRALLLDLAAAVDRGIESPLEYRYHHIERTHGMPLSVLQVRQVVDHLWLRADCIYEGLGVRVELDGQLAHPFGRTEADVWRDNAVLIGTTEITLRYRWFHVAVTPCQVARQVVLALRSRGWRGVPRTCGPGCAVAELAVPG